MTFLVEVWTDENIPQQIALLSYQPSITNFIQPPTLARFAISYQFQMFTRPYIDYLQYYSIPLKIPIGVYFPTKIPLMNVWVTASMSILPRKL